MSCDERDAWTSAWAKAKTRGNTTHDLVTMLVERVFGGANDRVLWEIILCVDDDQQGGDLVHGALRLCSALARRNRTAAGLMAITVALMDTEAGAAARKTRLAARMMLAHQICDDVVNFASIDRIDPGMLHALGANAFNEVFAAAGDSFGPVFIEALNMWRQLLPEVSAADIRNIATHLWTS